MGDSKIRAESTNALSYLIIFVCCLIYRKRVWSVWQGIALVFIKTWVRAPGPLTFHIIFPLIIIPCRFSTRRLPYTLPSNAPLGQSHSSKGSDLKNMVDPSQRYHTRLGKVKEARVIGLKLLAIHLTTGDNTPLRFANFYILYFFIIFFTFF